MGKMMFELEFITGRKSKKQKKKYWTSGSSSSVRWSQIKHSSNNASSPLLAPARLAENASFHSHKLAMQHDAAYRAIYLYIVIILFAYGTRSETGYGRTTGDGGKII